MDMILPIIVGSLPIQIMFAIYNEKVADTNKKWYIKLLYFLIYVIVAFAFVGLLGWLLFIKLGL